MWHSIYGLSRNEMWYRALTRYTATPSTKEKESALSDLCTSPTYPSGTPYPSKFRVHSDSLHFCAGGLFQAASPLLQKLIEQDTMQSREATLKPWAGSNTRAKSASTGIINFLRNE
jgi:hypothetical protein